MGLILIDISDELWDTLCSGLLELSGDTSIGSIRSVDDFIRRMGDPGVSGLVSFCDHSREAQSLRVLDPGFRIVFIHRPEVNLRLNGSNSLLISREDLVADPRATAERIRKFLSA